MTEFPIEILGIFFQLLDIFVYASLENYVSSSKPETELKSRVDAKKKKKKK